MRILFLTPQLPYPPRQGSTLRNFHLIEFLCRRHEVDLFTILAPDETDAPDSKIHQLCRRVVAVPQPERSTPRRVIDTLFSPLPDMALRLQSDQARTRLDEMVAGEAYDGIQIEGIEMGGYGLQAAGRQPNARLIFDDHNAEYLLQKRAALTDLRRPGRWPAAAYSLIQWRKLRGYERLLCRSANRVVVVSEQDRLALKSLDKNLDITVIPNGIDLDYYALRSKQPRNQVPRLVFSGKMDYRPNVDAILWFYHEVLPLVRRKHEVTVDIVGMNPHQRLDRLRQDPGIRLTGTVPDVRPFLTAADLYLVPMRVGGGTRFKVLEALALGLPTVSTSLGAEGIPVEHGRHILIADRPEDFAQEILRLLNKDKESEAMRKRLIRNGREFVAAMFGWNTILPGLEAIHHSDSP